mgnify:CR=1 FL=1
MGKLIALLLIIAACVYCYLNFDFSNIKENSKQKIKQEKTINAVQQGRRMQYNDAENSMNNY